MPRGGKRTGSRATAYKNRTDLNGPPKAEFTGQPYGQATAQAQSQAAVPTAPPPGHQHAGHAPTGPAPGSLPPLDAPTGRPNELLTAGLLAGDGPGPEALAFGGAQDEDLHKLRAIYMAYPSEDLRSLIEFMENR